MPARKRPTSTVGFLKNDPLFEITPIWISRRDGVESVPAEIWSGPYIGADGIERYDSGSVFRLKSDECNRVFGECYPFGTAIGAEVSYYVKNGALIRLREIIQ